jgi:hypothetical protein
MSTEHGHKRYRPGIEGLEGRDLPSGLAATIERQVSAPHLNLKAERTPAATVASPSANAHDGLPSWVSQSYLQSLVNTLYAPVDGSPVPQPTPSEIRRQTFWMEFVGHYSVGAPRFSDQASTIHIYSNGRSATSNQFLNGRAQLVMFPPADPTATPTTDDPVAGNIAGLLSVFTANTLQSGDSLFAEVTNLPGVASNDPTALQYGLPSKLQFTIDPGGVSGGIYATPAYTVTSAAGQVSELTGGNGGAVAFNQGGGRVDITYKPTRSSRNGATQSGTVIVRVQGLINTTGTTNALYQGIN